MAQRPNYQLVAVTKRGDAEQASFSSESLADAMFRSAIVLGQFRYVVLIHNAYDGDYAVRAEWKMEGNS